MLTNLGLFKDHCFSFKFYFVGSAKEMAVKLSKRYFWMRQRAVQEGIKSTKWTGESSANMRIRRYDQQTTSR